MTPSVERCSEARAWLAMGVCVCLFALEPSIYVRGDAGASPAAFALWAAIAASATGIVIGFCGVSGPLVPFVFHRFRRHWLWFVWGAIGFLYIPLFALAVPRLGPTLSLVLVSVVPVLVIPVAIECLAPLRRLRRVGFSWLPFLLACLVAAGGLVLCAAARAGGFPQLWSAGTDLVLGLALATVAGALVPVTLLCNRACVREVLTGASPALRPWAVESLVYGCTASVGVAVPLALAIDGPSLLPSGGPFWPTLLGVTIALGALGYRLALGLSDRHAVNMLYSMTPVIGFGWLLLLGFEDPAGLRADWLGLGLFLVVAGVALSLRSARSGRRLRPV